MEKMQIVYLVFLLVGGLGLLLSLLLGEFIGDHDISGGDVHGDIDNPKIFSLKSIFAFLMAFGIGGGSMSLLGEHLWLQISVAIGVGIVTSLFVFFVMKILYSQQGGISVNSDNFINREAIVTIGTTSTGICQIEIDSYGGDRLYQAKEVDDRILKKNNAVTIVGKTGNTLLVKYHPNIKKR